MTSEDPTNDNGMLSASVLLQDGLLTATYPPCAPATDANANQRLAAILERFTDRGFEVSALFGPTFAITAPRSVFRETFPNFPDWSDAYLASASDRELELPLEDLEDGMSGLLDDIVAVFMTASPDFGPDNP